MAARQCQKFRQLVLITYPIAAGLPGVAEPSRQRACQSLVMDELLVPIASTWQRTPGHITG